ncbi:TetR/AcrR family transcriptional regulator [Mycobacterium sp. ACS4331]|uniref:TetR/AcrR family transcriptional regulator n=1 Tax=Mycobacterium sp. ACS4331 TaxID=1834121 RepID=UPI0007FD5D1B|nr:TetR/AcrR family transcriptional regulator [Mycobacterium sp. ACS4331]OBF12508.1 TetR family transcriptional regulator [Mycobacterium sp. ACS4331]
MSTQLPTSEPDGGDEVERILSAAVAVMQRVAPGTPRVSDIVAEANSSNKAFYRYFAGKDELFLAVMRRGVALTTTYLERLMAKETDPAEKIARWIEGVLEQVADPEQLSTSRATTAQMSASANRSVANSDIMSPMRDLLTEPTAALGLSPLDADAVFLCTTGTMRRFFGAGQRPSADDIAHVVRFCLRGIGVRR